MPRVLVYKVDGVEATALRDALIAAWKGDFPEMTVSQVTVGGKDVTKGDFGEDTITSYLYISGDVVYDIESSDETIATAALAALPEPGAPAPATSGPPAASCVPASGSSGSRAVCTRRAERSELSACGAARRGGCGGTSVRAVPGSQLRASGPRPRGGAPIRS